MESGSMIGGRYQLVDVVAEGGLSTVWQGVARSSEVFARPVAIKVMKRAFSTVGGTSSSTWSPRAVYRPYGRAWRGAARYSRAPLRSR